MLPTAGGSAHIRANGANLTGSRHFNRAKHPEGNTMNRYLTVGLSMLAGAALGGAAIQTLHAQAKAPVYQVTL